MKNIEHSGIAMYKCKIIICITTIVIVSAAILTGCSGGNAKSTSTTGVNQSTTSTTQSTSSITTNTTNTQSTQQTTKSSTTSTVKSSSPDTQITSTVEYRTTPFVGGFNGDDIPVYPGSKKGDEVYNSEEYKVAYTTNDGFDKVMAYFKSEMQGKGWIYLENISFDNETYVALGSVCQMYLKGTIQCSVSIIRGASNYNIGILKYPVMMDY